MIHCELQMPNGEYVRLDTNDSELIGDWLKSIFHSTKPATNGPKIAMEYRLRIY